MRFLFRRHKRQPTEIPRINIIHPLPWQRRAHFLDNRRFVDGPDAPYSLPKDLTDLNRLDFQHFLLRQVKQGNYLAPVPLAGGCKILDVGTGSGRWAIEMAQTFPLAQVCAVDLEEGHEITGQTRLLPPNYAFQTANVLNFLPFPDEHFDFVHQRLLVLGVPLAKWNSVISELLRVTKIGGWLELTEGGTHILNHGPSTARWFELGERLTKPAGIDTHQIAHLKHFAQRAGLPCESRVLDVPIGAWGGRIGAMMQIDLLAIFDAGAPRLRELGLSPVDIDVLREALVVEWNNLRCQVRFFVVYGQRPAPERKHVVRNTLPLARGTTLHTF